MDGCKLLQCSHPPEMKHRSFPSSERLVRILGAIVGLAARFLPVAHTNFVERCAIGAEAIGHHFLGTAMQVECFLHEFQRNFFCPVFVRTLSNTVPSWSTGRQRQCCRPLIFTKTSSRWTSPMTLPRSSVPGSCYRRRARVTTSVRMHFVTTRLSGWRFSFAAGQISLVCVVLPRIDKGRRCGN